MYDILIVRKYVNMKTIKRKEYVQPTSRGQVTIPASIRKQLGITADSLLEVDLREQQVIFKPIALSSQTKEVWETVVDFTGFSPTGIGLKDLQKRLWIKSKKPSAN